MIYYYVVKVQFEKGKTEFIKDYYCNFLEIGQLFVYLETKHKNNYQLIFIKERKIKNNGI